MDSAAAELGINAIESRLILVHHNHLMPAAKESQSEIRPHAPAADDNEIHNRSLVSETW
jgi:hypothetical protein